MTFDYSLQKLYGKHLAIVGLVTPLEKALSAFLKTNPPIFSVLDQLIAPDKFIQDSSQSPWRLLEQWRNLLAVNLMTILQKVPSHYREAISHHIQEVSCCAFWKECQLLVVFRALNRKLSNLDDISISPSQYFSGAAPFETGSHWTWANAPQISFQAEMGALWAVLGNATQNQELLSAAVKLAEWHLNTLDYHFAPFSGLLIQETDSSLISLVTSNYLLFHAVAVLANKPEMEYAAQKQLEQLEKILIMKSGRLQPYAVLLEHWIDCQKEKPQPVPFELPKMICDFSTYLVGYRSPINNLVCTNVGGKTGLGCLHFGDVHIVNYGPQHFPLGGCEGFGIECGANNKDRDSYQKNIDHENSEIISISLSNNSEFHLRSCVRIVGKPPCKNSAALFRNAEHSGIWAEISQKFDEDAFHLSATFLGLKESEEMESLAFSFFIKAKHCEINGKKIKSCSLDRYQGAVRTINFHSDRNSVKIDSLRTDGEIQVIPLAGGDNFWGADFLIAYLLKSKLQTYHWQIKNP